MDGVVCKFFRVPQYIGSRIGRSTRFRSDHPVFHRDRQRGEQSMRQVNAPLDARSRTGIVGKRRLYLWLGEHLYNVYWLLIAHCVTVMLPGCSR